MTTNYKFIQRLQWENWITEISDLNHNLWGIDKYEELIKSGNALYFISFTPNEKWYKAKEESGKSPRTKNEYVWGISYLKADFDIRSYIYEHEDGRIITDEELLNYKDKLLEWLKIDNLLGSYSAVIHSGNWIHIYWIWDTVEIDAKTYAAASTEIYNRIKDLFPSDQELRPDFACGNIWRLLRLPWSMNFKEKYGLPPHKVEILKYNEENSPLVGMLKSIWEKAIQDLSEQVKEWKQEMTNKCKSRFSRTISQVWDTYYKINHDVSIADLVCSYTWRSLANNGTNFISHRDWNYTGAFLIPEENIVVHMGTPHFSDYFKVYSPFSFIMVHYANGDAKRTFEIAKEMFPELLQEKKFYFGRTRNYGRN